MLDRALVAVAGKPADCYSHVVVASVAEEMALALTLDEAQTILAHDGDDAEERAQADGAFQDADFEILFDPRLDGLEDDERVTHLAMANRRFEEWFRPFRDGYPAHPYVAGE